MVTAELAVAITGAVAMMLLLCWGVSMLVLQLRLVDTAGAVARQAARGDRAGVQRAEAAAPRGTAVRIARSGPTTRVAASLRTDPFGILTPSVVLRAQAQATSEPGVE
ncbi:TadE family type IV pilus minor pilin [Microlunatus ginsengisoli]|uniref:Pilus assembly protein n=1 Tax=Microlunatus ginsengisoli TaxID=363863 RepID=A0ABP7APV0_9ACTN